MCVTFSVRPLGSTIRFLLTLIKVFYFWLYTAFPAACQVGPEPARTVKMVVWSSEGGGHHVYDFAADGKVCVCACARACGLERVYERVCVSVSGPFLALRSPPR